MTNSVITVWCKRMRLETIMAFTASDCVIRLLKRALQQPGRVWNLTRKDTQGKSHMGGFGEMRERRQRMVQRVEGPKTVAHALPLTFRLRFGGEELPENILKEKKGKKNWKKQTDREEAAQERQLFNSESIFIFLQQSHSLWVCKYNTGAGHLIKA